jgi:hypothetical protein
MASGPNIVQRWNKATQLPTRVEKKSLRSEINFAGI